MGVMQQPPLGPGQLIVTPHPLMLDGQRNVVWEARAGESLYAILQRNVPELDGQRWEVCIGGRAVERHLWHHVYPKQGQVIEVRGGVGRSALALVAVLALTYFTFGFGAATAGMWGAGAVAGSFGALAAAGVYMAGSMLINKVLAPKQPKVDNRQQDPVHSISGARNQLRLYEPYPLLFGRAQITPDLLSKPYTWYEGNDQFLGLLLSAGINVGRIEALYNGDTPLSNYEGVQVYHAGYSQMPEQTIPLYSNADTIDGAELTKDKAWVQRTTSADTVRIQINLEYVLGGTGTSGKSYYVSETVEAQYRPVGTTNWQPLASQTFRSDRFDVRRATLARDVARGQYDVRVRMLGQGNYEGKNTQKNDFQWTQLTSVQADDADYTGIARSGVRIKATGQLNGSPDELRGVAFAAPIPEWSGTGWVTKESSNPGAQCLAYARGIWAGPRLLAGMALADAQIDIESWKAFSLHCAANGYTYDFYVKEARSHTDVLAAIARAGFGEITWAGGRLGVVWAAQEQPLSGVVAMPTIKKGTFQVDYTLANAADGIEYTYIDSTDWQAKTLRVPAPGVDIMLNPAQVSGEGVSTEQHAARAARWHLAQHLYQYKDIGYSTDIEHLSYQRLSLLALQHDLTQWGYGGRVQGASGTGGAMTLLLDEPVPAPAAGNAYIGVRIPGERVYRVLRVQPFSGMSNSITLADPWPADAAIPGADPDNQAHDTIWVYDFRQTPGYRVRVTSIEPEPDLKGAAVRVVPEGPEFWDYVLTGHYIPAPNQSLLQTRPVASNLRISEAQIVQGNTTFTELTATFDVSGPVGNIVVLAAGTDMELQEVAQTQTRTATWRAPAADAYRIVVRPFSPDGEAGVAVSTLYATVGADVPPVLVDLFGVEERSGGVRLYTWGWLDDTMRSADFAGVEIRYVSGNVPAPVWDAMTPVGETGYHTAPFEAVVPAAGQWTFACRSRNAGGQLSTGMRIVTKTLGANLGEQIGGIGENLEEITQRQVAQQQAIDQEILDRLAGDFAAVAQAVADARAYTDTQVAALNGILEDIVGADEWVAGTTYPKGDFVRHEGTMYRALAENTGVVPGSNPSVWQEIGDYTSVGDALAAAISMSTQNASDIAAESVRLDGVVVRMPPGTDQLARSAQVASEQQARIDGDNVLGQRIDTVSVTAGDAQSTAAQAITAANNAASVAATAQTAANGAQSTASQAMTAANNAATAVTQVSMQLGKGDNLFIDPGFAAPNAMVRGWGETSVYWQHNFNQQAFRPIGINVYGAQPAGFPAGWWNYLVPSKPARVKPDTWYIGSIYYAAQRTVAGVDVIVYDESGTNSIQEVASNMLEHSPTDWSQPGSYRRASVKFKTGPRAFYAAVNGRAYGATNGDPYVLFFWPQLEEATETQAGPTPYKEGAAGNASATQALSVGIDSVSGRVRAIQAVATDVQGRWIGFRTENDGVRGGTEFVMDYFRLLAADGASASMEMTGNYWRVFNANYQLVMGTGFGVSGNLMSWFGPNIGANNCTTANCIECKTTAGQTIIRGTSTQGRMEIMNTAITIYDANNRRRFAAGLGI